VDAKKVAAYKVLSELEKKGYSLNNPKKPQPLGSPPLVTSTDDFNVGGKMFTCAARFPSGYTQVDGNPLNREIAVSSSSSSSLASLANVDDQRMQVNKLKTEESEEFKLL